MKKIFILDDEPMFLDWIEDFTESLGFSANFLTSVNDAYEEINKSTIDEYSALVLDLNVPVSPEPKPSYNKNHRFLRNSGVVYSSTSQNKRY
jgi:CheY-like chemotaxis protein